MAKRPQYVWGIEIGQSALKALRCYTENDELVADAFDFVEYPKILSQPEADPESLVEEALEQFLSRNDLKGCKVAISVPGQSGLSKFFKPPPVEVKKIGDIVKYEARQQIPFDLEDVIWDYQQMEGAQIEDGYALESEVGLFAMKRDAVQRAIEPFQKAGIDIDLIQLSPMSIYSALTYDRFSERLENETFDPDAPPPSTVVLSIGTDSTDLVVTNGFRVWQRSMPIGGNHFTRQLTKDLKLTFAKAEHVKRNAMQADDPKLIFQAMRPVFHDFVTEIQRSLGFFQSQNKSAEIADVILLGNTVKLTGLVPYLNKNLGYECKAVEKFDRLTGPEVTASPVFKDNQMAFGVVYGLCLQMVDRGPIQTNLVPKEVVVERLIRSKKPWVVVAMSVMLLALIINFAMLYGSWAEVAEAPWKDAEAAAGRTKSSSASMKTEDETRLAQVRLLKQIGKEVASNKDQRILMSELLKTIEAALNRTAEETAAGWVSPDVKPFNQRRDFHFTRIDSLYQPELEEWFTESIEDKYEKDKKARIALLGNGAAESNEGDEDSDADADKPKEELEGPGWVYEIRGHHFYNGIQSEEKVFHVLKYLIEFLENGTIELPDSNGEMRVFTMKEMGISRPFIVESTYLPDNTESNPKFMEAMGSSTRSTGGRMSGGGMAGGSGRGGSGRGGLGGGGLAGGAGFGDGAGFGQGSRPGSGAGAANEPLLDEDGNEIPEKFDAPKFNFTVQFVWQETLISERIQRAEEAAEKAKNETGSDGNTLQASL